MTNYFNGGMGIDSGTNYFIVKFVRLLAMQIECKENDNQT